MFNVLQIISLKNETYIKKKKPHQAQREFKRKAWMRGRIINNNLYTLNIKIFLGGHVDKMVGIYWDYYFHEN